MRKRLAVADAAGHRPIRGEGWPCFPFWGNLNDEPGGCGHRTDDDGQPCCGRKLLGVASCCNPGLVLLVSVGFSLAFIFVRFGSPTASKRNRLVLLLRSFLGPIPSAAQNGRGWRAAARATASYVGDSPFLKRGALTPSHSLQVPGRQANRSSSARRAAGDWSREEPLLQQSCFLAFKITKGACELASFMRPGGRHPCSLCRHAIDGTGGRESEKGTKKRLVPCFEKTAMVFFLRRSFCPFGLWRVLCLLRRSCQAETPWAGCFLAAMPCFLLSFPLCIA